MSILNYDFDVLIMLCLEEGVLVFDGKVFVIEIDYVIGQDNFFVCFKWLRVDLYGKVFVWLLIVVIFFVIFIFVLFEVMGLFFNGI